MEMTLSTCIYIRVDRLSQLFKHFPSAHKCLKRDTLSRKTLAIFATSKHSGNAPEFPDALLLER